MSSYTLFSCFTLCNIRCWIDINCNIFVELRTLNNTIWLLLLFCLSPQVCTWGRARASPRSQASAPWAWMVPLAQAQIVDTSTTWAQLSRPKPPTEALLSEPAGEDIKGSTSSPQQILQNWLFLEGWTTQELSRPPREDHCRVRNQTKANEQQGSIQSLRRCNK